MRHFSNVTQCTHWFAKVPKSAIKRKISISAPYQDQIIWPMLQSEKKQPRQSWSLRDKTGLQRKSNLHMSTEKKKKNHTKCFFVNDLIKEWRFYLWGSRINPHFPQKPVWYKTHGCLLSQQWKAWETILFQTRY